MIATAASQHHAETQREIVFEAELERLLLDTQIVLGDKPLKDQVAQYLRVHLGLVCLLAAA